MLPLDTFCPKQLLVHGVETNPKPYLWAACICRQWGAGRGGVRREHRLWPLKRCGTKLLPCKHGGMSF
jgi:hypothetical protein